MHGNKDDDDNNNNMLSLSFFRSDITAVALSRLAQPHNKLCSQRVQVIKPVFMLPEVMLDVKTKHVPYPFWVVQLKRLCCHVPHTFSRAVRFHEEVLPVSFS